MAIPKLYEDVENALRYPDSLGQNGTTQHEFQEFIRNIYGVLDGLTGAVGLWQPNTAFTVGTVITSPSMQAGTLAVVTQTGTTSAAEPTSWTAAGTEVTDGTVKYKIIPSYLLAATNEETVAGTNTEKAVTPAGLASVVKSTKSYVDSAVSTVDTKVDTVKTELIKYADRYVNTSIYQRTACPSSNKTTVTIPAMLIGINGSIYQLESSLTVDITKSASWDSANYIVNTNRAGKDFYIYAIEPSSGSVPSFILSANSTVPTGYTASNSRKIGGFHCLCLSVGTISGHTLSGYVTGDILPASMWDLLHRCKGENEGMVYDEADDVWLGIYLLSYSNSKAVSVYGGTVLDGESTPKTHGLWFTETLAKQKMRLPYLHEFFTALKGCQECVNISGSKDWGTTGGHVYTNNVRCISNIGLEDPTGFMWQWSNNYGMAGGSSWSTSTYDSNVDSKSYGSSYGSLWLPRVGGRWDDGSYCGSRSVVGGGVAASRDAVRGARCASEPRVVSL